MYQLRSILIYMLWCKQNVAGRKLNTEEKILSQNLPCICTYSIKQKLVYFIIILSPWVYFAFLMFPIWLELYLYEQLNCITSHFFKIYCTLTFEGLFPATAEVQDKD